MGHYEVHGVGDRVKWDPTVRISTQYGAFHVGCVHGAATGGWWCKVMSEKLLSTIGAPPRARWLEWVTMRYTESVGASSGTQLCA